MAIINMFKVKKPRSRKVKKDRTIFFVIVCLFNFFIIFGIFFSSRSTDTVKKGALAYDSRYLQEQKGDPFITRNPNLEPNISEPVINGDDPSLGNRDAVANLILFFDPDCPYCREQYQVIKRVYEKYSDDLRLVWKDYPDKDRGSSSWQVAVYGRCAYEQEKFWDFLDIHFSDMNLPLPEAASKAGLDQRRLAKCLSSEEAPSRVQKNIKEADSLGIVGVPFIYVNKRGLLGEVGEEELESIIKFEIQGATR
ncbi:thioredoxin domain-containing protein [Candidatus Falkowbacteria bacterium]|nr:thioredoxin domain-containing protein [Candidatus Falkowbacteria bacterium]